ERRLRAVPERAARRAADLVAPAPPGAPRGPAVAPAPEPAADDRIGADPDPVGDAAGAGAGLLPEGVPARLPGRTGSVLAARALRARRRRHDQPPRRALQRPVPQRRLPHGTPRPPRRALDAAATPRRAGGAAQRLACGTALAGDALAGAARTPGAALAA